MHTVYYLAHGDSDRRLRWYATLAGARIAQRSRNKRLGFALRLERVVIGHREWERCLDSSGMIVDATWFIEEGLVDTVDLEL